MGAAFRPDLLWAALEMPSARAAMKHLGQALVDRGLVRPSFPRAVIEREAAAPTGLAFPSHNVAVPHADPEHVIAPAIALATLDRPVPFGEMGNPEAQLDVEIIAMLALPDKESAQSELVRMIERFQDAAFLDRICAAPDREALLALLGGEGPR
jgi:PTS system galactitol-specific IIA component